MSGGGKGFRLKTPPGEPWPRAGRGMLSQRASWEGLRYTAAVLIFVLIGGVSCRTSAPPRPAAVQPQIEPWRRDYYDRVYRQIHSGWIVPERVRHLSKEVRVSLRVARAGRVLATTFETRSGDGDLDASVERAIERAREQGLPPLPAEYVEDTLEFGLIFNPAR